MSYFDSNDADDGIEIIKADDDEEKEVDDEKSKTKKDALSPAMKALVKTMAGMMKKTMTDAGADKADIDKAMASFSKLVDEKLTEPAKKAAKQEDEEEEEKKKGKGGKAKQEDDEEDGKKPNPFAEKDEEKKKAAEPIFKIDADGGIHVSGDIAKGRRMTAGRVEKIAQLFGHTAALLKELSPDTFEKALAAIAKGDLPKDPGFESQVRPMGPSGVKKSDDSENTELRKAVGEMTERLEKIEKARKGTSSVDGDGGTDENVEKGFWAGVL